MVDAHRDDPKWGSVRLLGAWLRCRFGGVGEFPEVVADGMECPFAFGAGETSEPEMFGVLSGFHLPEHGFNDRFSSGVVGPPGLGPHPACHAFTLSRVVRDPPSGCIGYPFVVPNLPGSDHSIDVRIGELLEVVL